MHSDFSSNNLACLLLPCVTRHYLLDICFQANTDAGLCRRSKIVGENRRDGKLLSHTGFYALKVLLNIPVVHVYIDLHALLTNNFEHRVLRIEPIIITAVQRCAINSRSTEVGS